ncbi:MAG: AbrB/MazE/SpoVT family DNA-binding domain-containing protein [Bacilli bacterium]
MKNTGVSRELDTLGRVVIPKELRTTMGLEQGSSLEIFYDEKGQIILQKFRIHCEFCGRAEDLLELRGKKVCRSCAGELRHQA